MIDTLAALAAWVITAAATQPPSKPPAKPPSELPAKVAAKPAVAMATLDLEWEMVEDAVAYEVKLTPAAGGAAMTFIANENRISREIPAGAYRLRIRSKDKSSGYFGPWSDPTEVDVIAKVLDLIKPADKTTIPVPTDPRLKLEFEWSAAPGAKMYTLKIWSDDISQAHVFKTPNTKKNLLLPTAKTYSWQVTFETASSVSYQADPKIYTFTLLGARLLQPIVDTNLTFPNVQQITWSKSPKAESYHFKLLKHFIDETEWTPFLEEKKAPQAKFSFKKLEPAAYRVEVIAEARNYVASEVGSYEFVVKPSQEELGKILASLRLPSGAGPMPEIMRLDQQPSAEGVLEPPPPPSEASQAKVEKEMAEQKEQLEFDEAKPDDGLSPAEGIPTNDSPTDGSSLE